MSRTTMCALLAASLLLVACDQDSEQDDDTTDDASSQTESPTVTAESDSDADAADESDTGPAADVATERGTFDVVLTALRPNTGNAAYCAPVITYTNNTGSAVTEYIFNLSAEAGESDVIPIRCAISDEVAAGATGEETCTAGGASCETLVDRQIAFTDTSANCDLVDDPDLDWGQCAGMLNVSVDIVEVDLGETEPEATEETEEDTGADVASVEVPTDTIQQVPIGEGLDVRMTALQANPTAEDWCQLTLAYTNNTDHTISFHLQLDAAADTGDVLAIFCMTVGREVPPGATGENTCDVPASCATLEGRDIAERADRQQCTIDGDTSMDQARCSSLIHFSAALDR